MTKLNENAFTFKPLTHGRLVNTYQLDESISTYRDEWCTVSFLVQLE